jgi:hypothetical protein
MSYQGRPDESCPARDEGIHELAAEPWWCSA